MSKTLEQKLNQLSPARRKRVKARAAELIAEETSLQALRRAHRLTQEEMAEKLGIGQEGVSRLEKRSDLMLSTLRSYVEALGGKLSIIAEFPKSKPVRLKTLNSLESDSASVRR
jgi:transcriptional regulator with XRE-family HTH domain